MATTTSITTETITKATGLLKRKATVTASIARYQEELAKIDADIATEIPKELTDLMEVLKAADSATPAKGTSKGKFPEREVTVAEIKAAMKSDKDSKEGESNTRDLQSIMGVANKSIVAALKAAAKTKELKMREKSPHYFVSLPK